MKGRERCGGWKGGEDVVETCRGFSWFSTKSVYNFHIKCILEEFFFERKSASKSIPYYQNVLFVVVSKSHQDKAMNTRQKAIIESLKMQYLSSRSWILFCNFFFFSTTLVIFSSSSCALTSKSVIKSSDSTLRVWRPLARVRSRVGVVRQWSSSPLDVSQEPVRR